MGNCDGCLLSQGLIPGDGVVRLVNASLSNIYSNLTTPKNEFIYTSSAAFEIHSDLPKAINVNLQALDEPNHLWLAYGVEFDKIYKGFIYKQPLNGYLNDFDDYKFTVLNNNIVNILINNITSTTLMAKIFDVNGSQIGNTYSGNMSNPINISLSLSAGNYYLEIYTLAPTTTENIYSYNFTLSSSLSNPDFTTLNSLKIYPNPTTSKVFFDNTKSNFNDVVIFNYLGQEVGKTTFSETVNNQEIDLSSFASGVYVLKFSNQESSQSVKIIKD